MTSDQIEKALREIAALAKPTKPHEVLVRANGESVHGIASPDYDLELLGLIGEGVLSYISFSSITLIEGPFQND